MSTKAWRVMGLFLGAAILAIPTTFAQTADRTPGDPIPGATVKVGRKPPGSGKIVAQGTTDDQGRCTFKDLAPGTYFLRFELNGHKYEVAANDAGERITVAAPPKAEGETSTRMAVRPIVYTKDLGEVIVTVEVVGSALTSNLNLSKSNVDRGAGVSTDSR